MAITDHTSRITDTDLNGHPSDILHYSRTTSIGNSTTSADSTTSSDAIGELCEANVLISLIDGVETRQRCQYHWRRIYRTSEQHLKRLCDFHAAFMDFACAQDEDRQEATA